MKKLHFSLADWEFQADHHFYISEVEKVSDPSSLAHKGEPSETALAYCYLGDTLGHNIPNGSFITYWRNIWTTTFHEFYFRQQTPLAYRGDQNGYYLVFDGRENSCQVRRYIDGVGTVIGNIPNAGFAYDTWMRFKVDFYEYITADLTKTFRIELFFWTAGAWQSQGYVEDGDNAFATSAVNRIGFSDSGTSPINANYHDDTEIWLVTE